MASNNVQPNQEKGMSDNLSQYFENFNKIKEALDKLKILESTSKYTLSQLCKGHEEIENNFIVQKTHYDAFSNKVFESEYGHKLEEKINEIDNLIDDINEVLLHELNTIRHERMKETSHLTATQANRRKIRKALGKPYNNATLRAENERHRGGTYSDNLKRYKRHTKRNKRNKRKTRRSKH